MARERPTPKLELSFGVSPVYSSFGQRSMSFCSALIHLPRLLAGEKDQALEQMEWMWALSVGSDSD
jgi:hypothetical protein